MARRLLLRDRRLACETERKLDVVDPDAGRPVLAVLTDRTTGPHRVKVGRGALSVVALCVLAAVILLGTPVGALAQGEPATAGEPRAAETTAAAEAPTAVEGETHEAAEHEEGLLPVVARLVNFAILIGTLVYLLRSPLATYLKDRGTQIRSDLINAAELKRTAAAQLEEIDRKMKALPGELEALRAQGAQEIAAEETRIRSAAAAERDRLLEQARRDIDQHVKVAERELVNHAADLAVGVAAERIKRSITDDDQRRLADRYVQQLKGAADGQR